MLESTLDFPILIVDGDFHSTKAAGVFMRKLATALENLNFKVFNLETYADATTVASNFNAFSCILISVEGSEEGVNLEKDLQNLLEAVHKKNENIPIFYVGERKTMTTFSLSFLNQARGVLYLFEDTSEFLARQVGRAAHDYLGGLLPPFFKALVKHAEDSAYSWHTPGHAGGVAFIKTPVGRAFHQFYGENIFRTDLSISVPEMGNILDHTGPIGAAEKEAAQNFGADHTFFVLNGTSTANKIVWQGMVSPGDIVLVDRNCHKSISHSIVMTGTIPVYLSPSWNKYGIIGPISLDQFTPQNIQQKINDNALVTDKSQKPKLLVVTNSTYDGVCYNVEKIKDTIEDTVDALHFDEAWTGYAAFHEFYNGHYGMSKGNPAAAHPIVFATHSTHKLLAAFSQASMLHVKNSQTQKLDFDRFNEAYTMHSSTSPNYPIMASLDVASQMMAGPGGIALMEDTIDESITFRRLINEMGQGDQLSGWWFSTWEPKELSFTGDINREEWQLEPDMDWHGFNHLSQSQAILDPTKVTILCPGVESEENIGIPAVIVSKYLWERGLTVEKTGIYSILVLFSIGITKGKWSTLITELLSFKRLYDSNAPLNIALKTVAPSYDNNMGLKDFCTAMHEWYVANNTLETIEKVYGVIPTPKMPPAKAYEALVKGNVELLNIDEDIAIDRIAASMVVPTPPGIPMIMPGEVFTQEMLDYLRQTKDFDQKFPGFENGIHGLIIKKEGSVNNYYIDCLSQ